MGCQGDGTRKKASAIFRYESEHPVLLVAAKHILEDITLDRKIPLPPKKSDMLSFCLGCACACENLFVTNSLIIGLNLQSLVQALTFTVHRAMLKSDLVNTHFVAGFIIKRNL